MSSPAVACKLHRNVGDLDVMSNSRRPRMFRRLWWCVEATSVEANQEARVAPLSPDGGNSNPRGGGALEDVQATLEFIIYRRKILTELDAEGKQLTEDDTL